MDFKMGEWGNNERFTEDPVITVSNFRFNFNVRFVKENSLETSKYVYINGPVYKGPKTVHLAFLFSESADIIPGVKPFTLNKNQNAARFQFVAKKWFDKNNLKGDQLDGVYTPHNHKDPRLGQMFVIEVAKK